MEAVREATVFRLSGRAEISGTPAEVGVAAVIGVEAGSAAALSVSDAPGRGLCVDVPDVAPAPARSHGFGGEPAVVMVS